jgi:predicted rRNA methylase YqxC with S4 and FtsJ domains
MLTECDWDEQVAEKLRQDGRLIPMEKFNLRHLTAADLPEAVDIVTLDLSFISVLKVRHARGAKGSDLFLL